MAEWKTHPTLPEYQLSSDGEVRSIYTMRPLVGRKDKDGYRALVACSGGRRLSVRVATMVLEAWVGPRPPGYVARHLNGVRDDNRPANLAWSTQKENIADKEAHGTVQRGERSGMAKLTAAQAERIKRGGEPVSVLVREFGICRATVYHIRSGRLWKHL